MAQPLINIGAAINDGTGELGPRTWLQKLNRLPIPDNTVNPLSGDYSGTYEQKITAAIADGVATGKKYCWITQPYIPANVTFNNAIRMIYEGSNPAEFDIRAYGAAIDNITNDLPAWTAAVAGATAYAGTIINAQGFPAPIGSGGGVTVRHPGGVSLVNGTITIPNDSIISILGGSTAVIKATGSAFGPMMVFDAVGGAGNRFGIVRDLTFNGNSIATIGLDVGLCVQRLFENIVVRFCTSVGLRVRQAQNCCFINCQLEENGTSGAFDCQLLLDQGAGNNLFNRCEFDVTQDSVSRGTANVILRQSSAVGPFTQPSDNTFLACVFERSSTTHTAQIWQKAGRNNVFLSCDISAVHATSGVATMIGFLSDGTDTAGGALCGTPRFLECRFAGTLASSIAIKALLTNPVTVVDCLIENFNVAFQADDSSYFNLIEPIAGAFNTWVQPLGAKNASQLATGTHLINFAGIPSGVPVFNPLFSSQVLYDSTYNEVWGFNGSWGGTDLSVAQGFVAWSASVTINAALGRFVQINAGPGQTGAWTLNNPSNCNTKKFITVDFYNTTAGAMAVPTLGSAWKTAGALVMPATGFHRAYTFAADPFGGGALLHEICRNAVDVPH